VKRRVRSRILKKNGRGKKKKKKKKKKAIPSAGWNPSEIANGNPKIKKN
jgi:hypothetical protein